MQNKQDLTEYSDNELSLLVFNDEYLYRMRHHSGLYELLKDLFIYEQLEQLKQDLENESN
jgi:hypothetical protein